MADEEVTYVKLISAEGHEFLMDRSVAVAHSKTMRLMLEGSFREAQDNVIRFPDLAGYILERVVKYLYYKARYSNSSSRIPEFVRILFTLPSRADYLTGNKPIASFFIFSLTHISLHDSVTGNRTRSRSRAFARSKVP
jgi:elongin-C